MPKIIILFALVLYITDDPNRNKLMLSIVSEMFSRGSVDLVRWDNDRKP